MRNILNIICGIILLIAIQNWFDYSFYTLLRWVIFTSAIYITSYYHKSNSTGWFLIFTIITLVFNPIFPLKLSKLYWVYIDVITSGIFFISYYFLTKAQRHNHNIVKQHCNQLVNKVKLYFLRFPKNKTNINVIFALIVLSFFLIHSDSDKFWLLVLSIILLLGLCIDILFNIPLIKSVILGIVAVVAFVSAVILYAVIRDTYFPNHKYSSYKGGYAPNGTFCDYGYKRATKECCDEDDYSCEMCDLHGTYCDYKDVYQGD